MAMRYLLEQPNNKWWDDAKTKDRVETRDEILAKSFKDAYDEMVNRYTEDTKNWAWGKLHTASFQNATLGKSGIAPIEWLFNRNGYQTAGGASIVNATGYRIAKPSDKRTDAKTFEVTAVPSMRMIVDLADLEKVGDDTHDGAIGSRLSTNTTTTWWICGGRSNITRCCGIAAR